MKKLILLVAVAAVASLGGCITAQERMAQANAKNASADDESCRSYGATPGTQPYITCRTQLQAARLGAPPPAAAAAAPITPTPYQTHTTSCMRTGTMVSCNTL
jgi:hypothetical protein